MFLKACSNTGTSSGPMYHRNGDGRRPDGPVYSTQPATVPVSIVCVVQPDRPTEWQSNVAGSCDVDRSHGVSPTQSKSPAELVRQVRSSRPQSWETRTLPSFSQLTSRSPLQLAGVLAGSQEAMPASRAADVIRSLSTAFQLGPKHFGELVRGHNRGLPGEDLLGQNAMDFVVHVGAGVGDHDELVIHVGGPAHGREDNAAG